MQFNMCTLCWLLANSCNILSHFLFHFSALRATVQAFRREDELHLFKATKRKRERFEQVGIFVRYSGASYMI